MDREIILERGGRGRAVRNGRCINDAIRACLITLGFLLVLSLVLMVSGFTENIPVEYAYVGTAGIIASMVAIYFLIKLEAPRRDDSTLSGLKTIRRWAGRRLRGMVGRRGVAEMRARQNDSVPHANATEGRTDDSPSGEASGESCPFGRPQSEIGMLASYLIRRHSDPSFRKPRPSRAAPTESRSIRQLQRSLNAIPSETERPVEFPVVRQSRRVIQGDAERLNIQPINPPQPSVQPPRWRLTRPWRGLLPHRQSRRVTHSTAERPTLRTLNVRQLPVPPPSWRMARPEATVPGSECELRLRHPVQRPGLPVWPWQGTPLTEFPRGERPSSASVPERARHGQSWPMDFTMARPPQQAVDDFSTPQNPSERVRPLGLPPVQRSRRHTDGVPKRPDPQILDVQQLPGQGPNSQVEGREFLPIPGAVSELEKGPNDPVQRQGMQVPLRQERPARGPCPLISQQEPGSHLQISPLRERPGQAQCPLVSQRQQGPLRIRQRASQEPDSEDSRSRHEPLEEPVNPTEETKL